MLMMGMRRCIKALSYESQSLPLFADFVPFLLVIPHFSQKRSQQKFK